MDGPSKRQWRIGELAKATGLTVRTLHHYEQIGLLGAARRTDGRQRVYGPDDVRRLYRIGALRYLGLSLADIARVLADERTGLPELLEAHRARVEAELTRLGRLYTLLDHACSRAVQEVEAEDVLRTIVAMSRVARRGDAQPVSRDAEANWRALGADLRACMNAGVPASAPHPQALAQVAHARIVAYAEGDPALLEALAHLRRFAPPKDLAGWTPELMAYLERALASLQPKPPTQEDA